MIEHEDPEMNDALSNFSSAEEPVAGAESFCRRAAEVCLANAEGTARPRDAQFLRYMGETAGGVADALAKHRETNDDPGLRRYLQYTPDEPAPGERELAVLAQDGDDPGRVLSTLCGATSRWVELFRRLESGPSVPVGRELYASCAELLDAWCRRLSTAYQQQDDA